jgi:hypothetical protein
VIRIEQLTKQVAFQPSDQRAGTEQSDETYRAARMPSGAGMPQRRTASRPNQEASPLAWRPCASAPGRCCSAQASWVR